MAKVGDLLDKNGFESERSSEIIFRGTEMIFVKLSGSSSENENKLIWIYAVCLNKKLAEKYWTILTSVLLVTDMLLFSVGTYSIQSKT